MTESDNRIAEIAARITAYLIGGGLFNPEMANHDAVRDLLIDCRAALSDPVIRQQIENEALERAAKVCESRQANRRERGSYIGYNAVWDCIEAIRALKG
jgi:hypothetical protein